jgi:hypothetical protein
MIDTSIQDSPVRLQIRHLLLWMVVAAVLLVQTRQLYSGGIHSTGKSPSQVIYFVSEIMIYATSITGMLVLMRSQTPWHRIRHPGHWMLVIGSLSLLFVLFARAVWPFGEALPKWLLLLWLVWHAIVCGSAAIANRGLWCAYFVTIGTVRVAPYVIRMLPPGWLIPIYGVWVSIRDFVPPIVTVMMVAYAVYDVRKRKRDSLHWIGVACDVLTVVNTACYMAYLQIKN